MGWIVTMLNVVGELVSHGSWLEIAFSFYLDVDELRFCMLYKIN